MTNLFKLIIGKRDQINEYDELQWHAEWDASNRTVDACDWLLPLCDPSLAKHNSPDTMDADVTIWLNNVRKIYADRLIMLDRVQRLSRAFPDTKIDI